MSGNIRLITAAGSLAGSLLAAGPVAAHGGELHAAEGVTISSGAGLAIVVIAFGVAYWLANRADCRSPSTVHRVEPGRTRPPMPEIDRPIAVPDVRQTYLLRASSQQPERRS